MSHTTAILRGGIPGQTYEPDTVYEIPYRNGPLYLGPFKVFNSEFKEKSFNSPELTRKCTKAFAKGFFASWELAKEAAILNGANWTDVHIELVRLRDQNHNLLHVLAFVDGRLLDVDKLYPMRPLTIAKDTINGKPIGDFLIEPWEDSEVPD